jgi:UDP-N-acetylglucosamine acyltransferase
MQKINPAKLVKPFSKENLFEEGFFHSNKTYIHPSSTIGPNVTLGNNVKIGPFCSILGNVSIGENTRIHSHTMIGAPAQYVGVKTSNGKITIGKNCEIREFIAIHASKFENGTTTIGNNCYIMNYSHIAHDVTLEDNVILINNVSLGGHVYVEHHAFLMASASAHQFCRIGAYTALAPFAGIRQDAPPFVLLNEQPGKFAGLNKVALKRDNVSDESIQNIQTVTRLFFQKKLPLQEIIEHVESRSWGEDTHVQYFLNFIKKSERGVSRRTINDR